MATLTEIALRAACAGRDLDLLNMGLMGVGPPEYRILAELGVPRFAPLREFARTRGIPLVDLTPSFVAESVAAPLYKLNDNHWTPRGNRVAPRSLAAFLAPLLCAPR